MSILSGRTKLLVYFLSQKKNCFQSNPAGQLVLPPFLPCLFFVLFNDPTMVFELSTYARSLKPLPLRRHITLELISDTQPESKGWSPA